MLDTNMFELIGNEFLNGLNSLFDDINVGGCDREEGKIPEIRKK